MFDTTQQMRHGASFRKRVTLDVFHRRLQAVETLHLLMYENRDQLLDLGIWAFDILFWHLQLLVSEHTVATTQATPYETIESTLQSMVVSV